MAISVSVGKRFEKLADYLISIGRFENRSEVVRHAMRLLEEDEYRRGYIHKSEQFSLLLSTVARLHDLQREKDYPSARTKWGAGGEFSPEVLAAGETMTTAQFEHWAKLAAGAPPAQYDGPREPAAPDTLSQSSRKASRK